MESPRARRANERCSSGAEILGKRDHISPISIWELTVLARKGRVVLNNEVQLWVSEVLAQVPIAELPMTIEVALEADQVELPHQDPADRWLVATARRLDVTLVAADSRILHAKACKLLPNV